jgi:hypothetical protein
MFFTAGMTTYISVLNNLFTGAICAAGFLLGPSSYGSAIGVGTPADTGLRMELVHNGAAGAAGTAGIRWFGHNGVYIGWIAKADAIIDTNVYGNARLTFSTPNAAGAEVNTLTMKSGRVLLGYNNVPASASIKLGVLDGQQWFASSGSGGFALVPTSLGGVTIYTFTGASGSESYSTRMTMDASGRLGLNATVVAWDSTAGAAAFQFGARGSLSAPGSGTSTQLSSNAYFDGANWRYNPATAFANNISLDSVSGSVMVRVAASGSGIISWITALEVTSTANVILGNARGLQWRNSAGTAITIMQLFSDNHVYFDSPNDILVRNAGGSTVYAKFSGTGFHLAGSTPLAAASQIALGASFSTTVGAAGGASALPAAPVNYWVVNVGGTNYKVPLYNS